MSIYTHVVFSFGRSFEGVKADAFAYFGAKLAPEAEVVALALEADIVPEGVRVIRVSEDGRMMGELPDDAVPLFVVNGGTTPQQWAMAGLAIRHPMGRAVNIQRDSARDLAPFPAPIRWEVVTPCRGDDENFLGEEVIRKFNCLKEAKLYASSYKEWATGPSELKKSSPPMKRTPKR